MKHITAIPSMILAVLLSDFSVSAQRNMSLADNAALRYWSAFSEVQDSAITEQQAYCGDAGTAARSVRIAIWGNSVDSVGDTAESLVGGEPNLGRSFICE